MKGDLRLSGWGDHTFVVSVARESNDSTYLWGEGCKAFIKHYGLRPGNFLWFGYDGDSELVVKFFKKDCCEDDSKQLSLEAITDTPTDLIWCPSDKEALVTLADSLIIPPSENEGLESEAALPAPALPAPALPEPALPPPALPEPALPAPALPAPALPPPALPWIALPAPALRADVQIEYRFNMTLPPPTFGKSSSTHLSVPFSVAPFFADLQDHWWRAYFNRQGDMWRLRVAIHRHDLRASLKSGWKYLVKDNNLQAGDKLVFDVNVSELCMFITKVG